MSVKYLKEVEITYTGMVIARVFSPDGRRTGLEFFTNPFKSVESRAVQAHAWADKHMDICERMEVGK